MKKKFLALVLTLAMVLSLVPATALATDGTSDTTTKDVVYGHYEGNAWTEGAPTRTDGLKDTVTVNKTAEKVDDQNNQYEVTLTVQMKHKTEEVQPGAAATVLVIDTSGSMNYCTDPSHTHTEDIWGNGCGTWNGRTSRLSVAKTAAINFLKSYSGFSDSDFKGDGSLKNNVTSKNLNRYVSLVEFDNSASVEEWGKGNSKKSWIDVSTTDGYNKLLSAINAIRAGGGTNLDAALRSAKEQMQSSSITQIDQSKKNVIALTDGVPTFYGNKVEKHGSYGCPDTNDATTQSADALKADGNAVYTVCFGAANDQCWTKDSAHTWYDPAHWFPKDKHATDGPTVGDFLKDNIATEEQYAYNADDANGLYEAFAAITQTITDGLNEGVVTDGLPEGVSCTDNTFGGDKTLTWNLNSNSNEATVTTEGEYNVYTYTKTYRVNVDPATAKTVPDNGVNYAPLNTPTTLTVQHNGSPVVIHFPIPAGKVTENPPPPELDSTDVYVYFQTQNTKGKPVDISGTSIQYNEHSWATLGKISTTQALTSGTEYTGTNDTLVAVGAQAKTDLKDNALYSGNKDIAAKVLPNITWVLLKEWSGADGYQPAEVMCWHLNGKLTVYGVTYLPGVEAGTEVTNMPENTQTYYLKDTTYTVSSNVPQRTGYTFAGWKSSEGDTVYKTGGDMQFIMPNKDVTLTAQWTPNNGTNYKVEHYQQQLDGTTYELKETDTLSGNTGDSVTAQSKTTYTGFTYDETVTGTVKSGTIAADGSLVLKLYYTRNSYGVTYRYESTDSTMTLPDAISETKGDYKIGDTNKYLYGDTVTRQDAPADGATYNVVAEDNKVTGTWTLKWEGDTSTTMPVGGVTFVGKWTYQAAPEPGKWTYTINQNFIDAKGEKTTKSVMKKVPDATNQTLQASIPAEMQTNQSFGNPAQNYLYIATETKYHVNSEEKNATDNLADGAVIDLYYYLDVIGENEKPDMPDSIPDCYQVTINYVTDNTGRGKITGLTKEVKTIKDATGNLVNKGTVKASGSIAEATGSRNYFSNWTDKTGKQVGNSATLEARTIDAKGGDVYIFTANFGRSSGSGSGGSNRPKPPVVEIPDDVPTGLNGKDHYAYVVGYPDGMVYPQKNITRAEVATIFFRLLTDETREANMTKSNGYNDMKDGAWYTCAVSTLSKMGIIKGYEDGSFKPDASISRAEFAAIAARFDPDGDKTPATFSDVSSHWAKDEISIAANHGWIKGYEDGSFKPDQKITRAETMTLVNRVLKRLPETKDDLHKDMKTWPDNQNESAWFYLAVQEATNSHYQKLKKDGTHETWESMRETRDWAALEK